MDMKKSLTCLLMLATAACGRIETRVATTGSLPPGSKVALATPDADLAAALTARGYHVDPDGGVLIDIGRSERPAVMAIDGQSSSRKRHFLQQCDYRTFRVTLSAVDRASGDVISRTSAEEHHCRAAFAEVAPLLVKRATGALGEGAGNRREIRQGRN